MTTADGMRRRWGSYRGSPCCPTTTRSVIVGSTARWPTPPKGPCWSDPMSAPGRFGAKKAGGCWDPAARERKVVTWHEPVQVRETEREALHDLPAMLRLIDAGKFGVSATTRRPGQAALKAVASVLYGGDFYTGEEEGLDLEERDDLPIKTFAWPLIAQAAGFASLSGTKLQLTAAGRKAWAASRRRARSAWGDCLALVQRPVLSVFQR